MQGTISFARVLCFVTHGGVGLEGRLCRLQSGLLEPRDIAQPGLIERRDIPSVDGGSDSLQSSA